MIDAFEHQFVQAEDVTLGNDAMTADELGDEINRPRMVARLGMLLEALAPDRHSRDPAALNAGNQEVVPRRAAAAWG